MSCGNAGSKGGGSAAKIDTEGIPQEFIDEIDELRKNEGFRADLYSRGIGVREWYARMVKSWRERHDYIQNEAPRATDLKVGDEISASFLREDSSARLKADRKTSYWWHVPAGRKPTKLDSFGSFITVTGIKRQKNGIRISGELMTDAHFDINGKRNDTPLTPVYKVVPYDALPEIRIGRTR